MAIQPIRQPITQRAHSSVATSSDRPGEAGPEALPTLSLPITRQGLPAMAGMSGRAGLTVRGLRGAPRPGAGWDAPGRAGAALRDSQGCGFLSFCGGGCCCPASDHGDDRGDDPQVGGDGGQVPGAGAGERQACGERGGDRQGAPAGPPGERVVSADDGTSRPWLGPGRSRGWRSRWPGEAASSRVAATGGGRDARCRATAPARPMPLATQAAASVGPAAASAISPMTAASASSRRAARGSAWDPSHASVWVGSVP